EEVAGHDPGVVPLLVVRHDLALHERVEALAEQVVLFGELRAPHGSETTRRSRRATRCLAVSDSSSIPARSRAQPNDRSRPSSLEGAVSGMARNRSAGRTLRTWRLRAGVTRRVTERPNARGST